MCATTLSERRPQRPVSPTHSQSSPCTQKCQEQQKNDVSDEVQGEPCCSDGQVKRRKVDDTLPPHEAARAEATPEANTLRGRFSDGTAAATAFAATTTPTPIKTAKVCARTEKKKQTPVGGGRGGTSSSSNSQGTTVTCEKPLCNKNPSFAHRGQTRRRFCKRHAEPGMFNVYYKYCDWDAGQCLERASFETSGKLRCLRHCEPGMRPRDNICQVAGGGCTRQSSYDVGGGKPILCTVHKVAGIVQMRRSAVSRGLQMLTCEEHRVNEQLISVWGQRVGCSTREALAIFMQEGTRTR